MGLSACSTIVHIPMFFFYVIHLLWSMSSVRPISRTAKFVILSLSRVECDAALYVFDVHSCPFASCLVLHLEFMSSYVFVFVCIHLFRLCELLSFVGIALHIRPLLFCYRPVELLYLLEVLQCPNIRLWDIFAVPIMLNHPPHGFFVLYLTHHYDSAEQAFLLERLLSFLS